MKDKPYYAPMYKASNQNKSLESLIVYNSETSQPIVCLDKLGRLRIFLDELNPRLPFSLNKGSIDKPEGLPPVLFVLTTLLTKEGDPSSFENMPESTISMEELVHVGALPPELKEKVQDWIKEQGKNKCNIF